MNTQQTVRQTLMDLTHAAEKAASEIVRLREENASLKREILFYHDDRLKLSNEVDRLRAALGLIACLKQQPADEPVACVGPRHDARLTLIPRYSGQVFERDQPLYARPQSTAWQGLTDEELELLNDCGDTDSYKFARAIEAKLREKNT